MLKSAREIDPRLLRSLFDGVIFKSEMINFLIGGGADHGELSGLADDDHTQYARTDGTRNITGLQTFDAGIATDTIAEKTTDTGVTVDSLLIQDGNIAAVDYSFVTANDGDTDVTAAELEELTDTSETVLHKHALEDHDHVTTSSPPVCLSNYVDKKERNAEYNLHGGLHLMDSGSPLDSVPTDIVVDTGTAKVMIVVNAGTDLAGEITLTGTTVNRDTGVETGADTDTITVDALTTDNSDADASGNARHSFTGAYITSKWFKGSVTLSTVDLTLTDVDTYCVAFEQFNDTPIVTLTTLDITAKATNTSAWLYAYLYTLKVTGDKCDIARIASTDLPAADVTANVYYRLRRGALDVEISGTTDGIWLDMFPGPLASTYWEDMNIKVWATLETEGDTIEDPILSDNFWNFEPYDVGAGTPGNIDTSDALVNPEVSGDTLSIDGYDISDLGYTRAFEFTVGSGDTATYLYFALANAISTGSFRAEFLVAHVSATGLSADFFNSVRAGSDQTEDGFRHSISKNSGNPKHRSYSIESGSETTYTDTTTTGTWVSAADDTGWTICQLEYNFSTKILKTQFKNLGTGHDTGQESETVVTPTTDPLQYIIAGFRNQGGSQSLLAQLWIGTSSNAWPEGKLNGVG